MTFEEILKEIYSQNLQKKVYTTLHSDVMRDYNSLCSENRGCRASLSAIKRINKGKNDVIDALCELE